MTEALKTLDEQLVEALTVSQSEVAITMSVQEWRAVRSILGDFKPGNSNSRQYRNSVGVALRTLITTEEARTISRVKAAS